MSKMSISSLIVVKARVILIFRLFVFVLFFTACSEPPDKKGFLLYQEGKIQEALPFLEKSCIQRNIDACKLTALIYANQKTPNNRAKMLQALNLACKYGEISSCHFVAKAYELISLYPQKIGALENGCQWGDPMLCFKLGGHYFQGNGVKKSPQKALELWIKSCYGGKKQGCDLALSLLQEKDPSDPQLLSLKKFSQTLHTH